MRMMFDGKPATEEEMEEFNDCIAHALFILINYADKYSIDRDSFVKVAVRYMANMMENATFKDI
jgi:hypothetical protein